MIIEEIVLNYLSKNLDVPVLMEVPLDVEPVETYVVLEKTSTSEKNFICRATFAIQSIAPTLYEAATLNLYVKKAMRDIEALPEISTCLLNSDYNFTDTTTKTYRYQAVFDLVHYQEE